MNVRLDPRVKASLLWGLVGALSFLVLVQGYELVEGLRLGFDVKGPVAVVVFAGAMGTSYVAEGRL